MNTRPFSVMSLWRSHTDEESMCEVKARAATYAGEMTEGGAGGAGVFTGSAGGGFGGGFGSGGYGGSAGRPGAGSR